MADHVVTGRKPKAEGWTQHIPAALRKVKLSEYMKAGRSAVTSIENPFESGGARFGHLPRQTKMEREQGLPRTSLRIQFPAGDINEASFSDKEFLDTAEYDYSFEPHDSDMLSLLEYSTQHLLLRATFKNNGAVVVYSSVPISVYARLQYVDNSGNSVGGAFWDLIRIYERRGLPVGGPYYPKQSNFVREDSKYRFLYEERGTSMGPRQPEYNVRMDENGNPTTISKKEAEEYTNLTKQILRGKDADGNILTPEQISKTVEQIRNMRNTKLSDRLLKNIRSTLMQEAEQQRTESREMGKRGTYELLGTQQVSGSAARGGSFILSKLEKLDPNSPTYAADRARLFSQYQKAQEDALRKSKEI